MCIPDYKLNASEICNAAGLGKIGRCKYMDILKRRSIVTQTAARGAAKHSWVPFQDGVFLCQVLKLTKEMEGLFAEAPITIPDRAENYFLSKALRTTRLPEGYATIKWNNVEIVYMLSQRTVNATYLSS
jgi:hypothetical protein